MGGLMFLCFICGLAVGVYLAALGAEIVKHYEGEAGH